MALDYTPRTWSNGETVTMVMLNDEVRDPFEELMAEWETWTPTWSAATLMPAIGNGEITGRCKIVGKTMLFRIGVIFGSTTDPGSGVYLFGLHPDYVPLFPNDGEPMGEAMAYDTSAPALRTFVAYYTTAGSNTVTCVRNDGSVWIGHSTYSWASGDRITIVGKCELP